MDLKTDQEDVQLTVSVKDAIKIDNHVKSEIVVSINVSSILFNYAISLKPYMMLLIEYYLSILKCNLSI